MLEAYIQHEHLLARIQLVLFMTGMGATLAPADFVRVFRRPAALLLGLTGQLVLAPLLALLIVRVAGLEAGVAAGLVLVAALPGGNLSKVFTYIARGNIALSISLSASATVLCVVTIPLVLHLMTASTLPADVDMPTDAIIVNELVLFLLSPLFFGMLLARLLPQARKPLAGWLVRAGLAVAVFMVSCSIFGGRIKPLHYGLGVPVAIIIFCLVSQQLSMLPLRLLRWPTPDFVAVGIETTMRNINLALALIALLFPASRGPDPVSAGVLFVALFYAGTAFFITLPLALRLRHVIRREQTRAASIVSPSPTLQAAKTPSAANR